MTEVERILDVFEIKRPVRSGKLKYFNLECKDLEQNFFCKVCRFINRFTRSFKIEYYPDFDGDALFLNEDHSPWKREMVRRAVRKGMKTIVVQHGHPGHKEGFTPLMAHFFMCWKESEQTFLDWGIEPHRLIVFRPEKKNVYKKINGIESVMFLIDASGGRQYAFEEKIKNTAEDIIKAIEKVRAVDEKVVIKPHPHIYPDFQEKLKKYPVVWDNADDLIHSASRIYSFRDCTTIKDAEVQGKKATVIEC